ncbi:MULTISPECIES: cadmium resistance transporter [unclassified Microcoleus]|uniref:cadmium resistance transporter n=1 Tax=unclassified Microcoleus TaxID=2642155 RepID=UPI002FD3E350
MAAVTVANGGDNIGIYLPLFASRDLPSLAVILTVFFVLVGVWCWAAYRLTLQGAIASFLTRYTQAIVPFVLIGLGIFILIDSGTYRLLRLFQSR